MATTAPTPSAGVSGNVTSAVPPSQLARIFVALAIGVASASFTAFAFARPEAAPDFNAWYRAAGLLLSGENPYRVPVLSASWPFSEPLYYPLPAALLTVPLARLSLPLAGAVFMGISGGLLAWLVTRDGLWRLWIFGSASYFMALKVGQWSPLVMVAALLPSAGFLAAMKPNLGLAALAHTPTRRAAIGCAVVGLLSFAVLPSWLSDWHTNLAALVGHGPPATMPIGPVFLLGLLRWRRPEARLLVAMAFVPQLLFWADQLPLFLVPRTRGELKALFLCTAAGFLIWYIRYWDNPAYVLAAAPYVLVSAYLPCLVMVLRRPNEAEPLGWDSRIGARLARPRELSPYQVAGGHNIN